MRTRNDSRMLWLELDLAESLLDKLLIGDDETFDLKLDAVVQRPTSCESTPSKLSRRLYHPKETSVDMLDGMDSEAASAKTTIDEMSETAEGPAGSGQHEQDDQLTEDERTLTSQDRSVLSVNQIVLNKQKDEDKDAESVVAAFQNLPGQSDGERGHRRHRSIRNFRRKSPILLE